VAKAVDPDPLGAAGAPEADADAGADAESARAGDADADGAADADADPAAAVLAAPGGTWSAKHALSGGGAKRIACDAGSPFFVASLSVW
jgi:hypothetical protein